MDSQPPINKPANFWPRFINFIIDHSICYGLVYLVESYEQFMSKDPELYKGIPFVIYVIYYTVTIGLLEGTIGMLFMDLKVIDLKNNKPIGFFGGFSRGIFMIMTFLTINIGHLMMLWDKKKRTIVDRATITSVVYK